MNICPRIWIICMSETEQFAFPASLNAIGKDRYGCFVLHFWTKQIQSWRVRVRTEQMGEL